MGEPQPSQQLVQMIVGSWVARAIYVAAKLQIADLLADGPQSAEGLAEAAGVAHLPMYRLLRALASVGVFAQDADGLFQLNPLAEPLREGGSESLQALTVMIGEKQDRCWVDLFGLPEGDGASFGKLLDVHMMAVTGGLERTEAEYRRLLADHGFRLTRVVPTGGEISVVEGVLA